MFLIGIPFVNPKASAAELNIRDFVNLLVLIGIITPDKIPTVNAFLAALDNSNNSTTTAPTNPIITQDAATHRSGGGGGGSGTTNRVILPSCTITADKESYNLNDTIIYTWTSSNATYAAWQQEDDSGKDHLNLPGDKLNTNGSSPITASVIGNPTVTLTIHNSNGSATCSKTVNITESVKETVKVTYPNGGEILSLGTKDVDFRTEWTSENLTDNIDVYLVFTDGLYCLIKKDTPISQGYLTTTLGNNYECPGTSRYITTGQYKVSLDIPDKPKVSDESDDYFNIISSTSTPQ